MSKGEPEFRHTEAFVLRAIDFVVLAKTFTNNGGGGAWFFAHDTKELSLFDIGHVTWGP